MSFLSKERYNALQKQYEDAGDNPLASFIKRMQLGLIPGLESQLEFATGVEPRRQQLLRQLVDSLSPAALQAAGQRQKNAIFENATRAGNQATMSARGMGLGDGAAGGLLGSFLRHASREASGVDQRLNDPQYRAGLYGQALGAVDQGMMPTFLRALLEAESVVTNQNEFNYQTRGRGLWGEIEPHLSPVIHSAVSGATTRRQRH